MCRTMKGVLVFGSYDLSIVLVELAVSPCSQVGPVGVKDKGWRRVSLEEPEGL